jgi:hypothetical protein
VFVDFALAHRAGSYLGSRDGTVRVVFQALFSREGALEANSCSFFLPHPDESEALPRGERCILTSCAGSEFRGLHVGIGGGCRERGFAPCCENLRATVPTWRLQIDYAVRFPTLDVHGMVNVREEESSGDCEWSDASRQVYGDAASPLGYEWNRKESRVSPAASVSSVRGVGGKNPWPIDTLLQPAPRRSVESRGLKNAPYWR